jgi:uncharacterized protein YaaR (DUF327 family)
MDNKISSAIGSTFLKPSDIEKKDSKTSKIDKTSKETAKFTLHETSNEGFIYSEKVEEELPSLLDDVHKTGERLKKEPGFKGVEEYKAAVRRFVKFVLDHSYDLEQKTSGISILRRKQFTLVKVIDQKLDRLAAEILSGQRDKLDILGKIDEIHGLLVDLSR